MRYRIVAHASPRSEASPKASQAKLGETGRHQMSGLEDSEYGPANERMRGSRAAGQ